MSQEKVEALEGWLREHWSNCDKCFISKYRQNVALETFRVGPIVFISKVPGKREGKTGEPFVNLGEKKLRKCVAEAGWNIESASIINVLGCRPPNNKDPRKQELLRCRPRVAGILRALQPKLLVLLGRVPTNFLLNMQTINKRDHGQVHTCAIKNVGSFRALITFHPAYVLRASKYTQAFIDDLKKAWEFVQ